MYEVMYPYFFNSRVGRAYILCCIIVNHTGYGTLIGTHLYTNVELAPVEEMHTLVKSEWKDIKTEEDVNIGHTIVTSTDKIRIVAKNNNPYLDGIKTTLKSTLLDDFYFVNPPGWGCIQKWRADPILL